MAVERTGYEARIYCETCHTIIGGFAVMGSKAQRTAWNMSYSCFQTLVNEHVCEPASAEVEA